MKPPVIEKRAKLYHRAECECGFDRDDFKTTTAAKRAALRHFSECGSAIYVTSERTWIVKATE